MDKQKIVDAAKLDILTQLEKAELGIFEFRNVSNIAGIVTDLFGHPEEHGAMVRALNDTESRYLCLHDVLLGRAFDGEGLLRKKYAELEQNHRQQKLAKLQLEDAAARINIEREALDVGKKALQAHAESLDRERERLGLLAADSGFDIKLPELPALPAVLELEEEEDTDD